MHNLAVLLGKSIQKLTRLSGGNGSALPGYVVERINKNFLSTSLAKLAGGVILVSGTNGKTTTTKIIADLLKANGHRVLTNESGSNFTRGVASLIVDKATVGGKLPYDIAVIEQDEAHAVQFVKQVKPRGVVLLNISRDQMDRFGEIEKTARLLSKVASAATEFVVLNKHDPRVANIAKELSVNTYFFDVSNRLVSDFPLDDDWHDDDRTKVTKAESSEVMVLESVENGQVSFKYRKELASTKPFIEGKQNYFNAAAAMLTVMAAYQGLKFSSLADNLQHIGSAFGRGEQISIGSQQFYLQLVKNPASFTQSLELVNGGKFSRAVLVINDNYADGRDMSWLWDVDFNKLKNIGNIVVGGTRATDMALRLKYDEVSSSSSDPNIAKMISALTANPGEYSVSTTILFCTYTAMLAVRKVLIGLSHVEQHR